MTLYHHPGGGWSIRLMRKMDLAPVQALFLECLKDFDWRGPANDELVRLRRTFLASEQYVAVEPQAGIIGFITLEEQNAYVPHLFVDADWRFSGVGRGLLEVARKACRRPLTLDVDRPNVAALSAYEAMGWKISAPAGDSKRNQIRLVGP